MRQVNTELIVKIMQEEFSALSTVLLFGSAAKGELKKDSDIDIAFLLSDPTLIDKEKNFNLKNRLSQELASDIDLIDMSSSGSIINFQIFKNSKVIFQDPEKESYFEKFRIKELGKYYDFKIERKEAEESLLKRRIID